MWNHVIYLYEYIWMHWVLQIKINLVYLEWDYSIAFFTYEKSMQN